MGLSLLAAFAGGLVSFLSPCVLPIVPAYLSVITGLDVSEVQAGASRHLGRITRDTVLFIAGFSAVFIALSLPATWAGSLLLRHQILLTRISGLVLVAMAAFLAGSLVISAPRLYQERRFHPSPSRMGPYTAPLAGVAFGFGWTPCIGPVLASVLTIAAAQGQVAHGAALLGAYSLGLGVPFLATGLAAGRLTGAFAWVKRHLNAITVVSAVLLACFGILLAFDRLSWVTIELRAALSAVGLGGLNLLG
ncbi:MAG: cytochrome c biogenesis CcdA family protein [Acidimicrobiales bacterium]